MKNGNKLPLRSLIFIIIVVALCYACAFVVSCVIYGNIVFIFPIAGLSAAITLCILVTSTAVLGTILLVVSCPVIS